MRHSYLILLFSLLLTSCAIKAADYGLSEEEFNARKKQFYSICQGQERKCSPPSSYYNSSLALEDFLNNYDKYNKYPVDLLQEALSKPALGTNYASVNGDFWDHIKKISKERVEKKIAAEKEIAKEREKAAEKYRLSKKYHKPWCDEDDSSGTNCLFTIHSYTWTVLQQTHDGTLISKRYRVGLSHHTSRLVRLIVRNNSDSSLPSGDWVPGGIFELTGEPYQYITPRGTVKMGVKSKRLETRAEP